MKARVVGDDLADHAAFAIVLVLHPYAAVDIAVGGILDDRLDLLGLRICDVDRVFCVRRVPDLAAIR